MQKKSPSEPRRDKSDDTAAHHAADAEDGDDEGPDEGDRGVAGRVQRLPFLQGLTPQLWKERVFLQGCAYQVTLIFLILFWGLFLTWAHGRTFDMGTFHVGRGDAAYLHFAFVIYFHIFCLCHIFSYILPLSYIYLHFAFVIYGFIEDIWAHIRLGPVLDQLWEETYL